MDRIYLHKVVKCPKICDIEVCRICLRNKSKFYDYDEYNLKKYYEEVTNKSINKKDGLPRYFCYECAALLHKFHIFREKCDYGDKILKEMAWSGPLTYAGIQEFNAKGLYKLKHLTLDILVSSKHIKTYNCNHDEVLDLDKPLKTDIINEEFTEGPFSDDDNFACNNPKSDPVDFDPFDGEINNDEEVNIETVHDTKIDLQLVKEKLAFDLKEVYKIDVDFNDIPQHEIVAAKLVKSKCNVKSKQITKSKNNSECFKKIKAKMFTSDDDRNDIELSKIKSNKSIYKFNRPKSVSNYEFLNSENWKKYILSDEEAMEEFQKKAFDKKYENAPYKCELCYRGFSQKSMLDRHMPQRHDESVGRLSCRFCKMRFKSNCYVNKHSRQHYNKYECLRCGLVCCLESTALFHEEYHRGVKRKCQHCDKEFQHLSTFYSHLRTHRSKHMCSLCGESFVSELGLQLHRKAKHQTENNTENVGAKYCEVCKMNFETKVAYQNHLAHSAMHTEENKRLNEYQISDMIEEADKKEDKGNSDTTIKGLVNRRSMVEKELSAVRKNGVSRDTRNRLNKKPTSCQHCGATFESLSAGLRHHLAEHRGKPFYAERVICEICGASLAPSSLAVHMNKHTQSKLYTCDTCGRSFGNSNILKNHLVTHTGEKNHACSLCDKRFTQKGRLNLHYRKFHLKQPHTKRNRRKIIEKEEE